VAEQPLRAGRSIWSQPRADIGAEHDPPVLGSRQRQPGQRATQPGHLHPTMIERVVERAVAAAVLGRQRQLHQRLHQTVGAQQRVGQLEQLISPRGQTAVEHLPEPGKITPADRV
jgi:hypothetical protein